MPKYLYNGVELPALPEWDREKYPYAWIRGIVGSDGVVKYHLRVSSEAIIYRKTIHLTTFEDRYVFWQYGTGNIYRGITTEDSEWELFNENAELDNYFDVDGFVFSWVNCDVINETDGSVYLAASEPIPVDPDFDLDSWLIGFSIGLASEPLPLGVMKNMPVAYLYNGVRLPPLPEWDREMYPYALIYFAGFTQAWILFVTDVKGTYGGSVVYYNVNKFDCSSNGEAEWGNFSECKFFERYVAASTQYLWSNYDILNEDGTLYLAASEPVPVYE